jgi:hypothetical protein
LSVLNICEIAVTIIFSDSSLLPGI